MQTLAPSVLQAMRAKTERMHFENRNRYVSRSTSKMRITMTRMLIAAEASWFKCRMAGSYVKGRNKENPRNDSLRGLSPTTCAYIASS